MGLAQMMPQSAKAPGYNGPPATFSAGPNAGQAVPGTLPNGKPNPYADPNSKASQGLQKALAKRQAAMNRLRRQRARGPQAMAADPSGTGGPNDPAWQHLADLYRNGLPG